MTPPRRRGDAAYFPVILVLESQTTGEAFFFGIGEMSFESNHGGKFKVEDALKTIRERTVQCPMPLWYVENAEFTAFRKGKFSWGQLKQNLRSFLSLQPETSEFKTIFYMITKHFPELLPLVGDRREFRGKPLPSMRESVEEREREKKEAEEKLQSLKERLTDVT